MQIYLKRIEWEEEEQHPVVHSYSTLEGRYPLSGVLIEWNRDMLTGEGGLFNTYINSNYLDSYASLESAKKACQDEVDRLLMSCIEIEREWRE